VAVAWAAWVVWISKSNCSELKEKERPGTQAGPFCTSYSYTSISTTTAA
jgi:hypothetical protein